MFYPPLPDPPRIQYLLSVSSPEDIGIRKGSGGFERFVTGTQPEEGAGALQKPYGVALHEGKLYVVDTRGPGYAIFDLPGKRYKFVSGEGAGRMRKPINIRVDRDGNRYVTDTEREQVLVFDARDRFVRAFGKAGQFRPGDVEVGGDHLYVSDLEHHRIEVLDRNTGETVQSFGKAGSREGEMFFPTNLSLGPDHFLYVTDTGNFRIQKFTFFGKKAGSVGTVGISPGQFARPKGIALDRRNRLFVVDAAFENVQIFDPEGNLLLFFGGPGTEPGSLNLPASVHIDYESAPWFQKYADPRFRLEYVIAVTNQFGLGKVVLFGFGRMEGMQYPEDPQPARKAGGPTGGRK